MEIIARRASSIAFVTNNTSYENASSITNSTTLNFMAGGWNMSVYVKQI